jgi:hypothetical protein
MREVDKAWGSLTIQQREMSDAVHTALVEAAAIAYKHESVRSAIRPGQGALQVNKSETENDAAKMAYEAGYKAGRGGGRGGGGRGGRGRGNIDPCNHCGRNHIGICWSNPDTAHLVEWDKVPEHLHAKINPTLYNEELKKKRSADKKPGGGRLTTHLRLQQGRQDRPNGRGHQRIRNHQVCGDGVEDDAHPHRVRRHWGRLL